MSYLQIKRLVDEHIKSLNAPIVLDEEMRGFAEKNHISEKTMASVLLKCNLAIKRRNRSVYSKQVVHQIVQQILKSEEEKLKQVSSQLARLYQMIEPITNCGGGAERVGAVNAIGRLARELPESRHLFAISELPQSGAAVAGRSSDLSEMSVSGIPHEAGAHADTHETPGPEADPEHTAGPGTELLHGETPAEEDGVSHITTEVVSVLGSTEAHRRRAELREQYEELRAQLVALSDEIAYNQDKGSYIRRLASQVQLNAATAPSAIDLQSQISRFNILVEKLALQST